MTWSVRPTVRIVLLYPLFPHFLPILFKTSCLKHNVKLHNYALMTTHITHGLCLWSRLSGMLQKFHSFRPISFKLLTYVLLSYFIRLHCANIHIHLLSFFDTGQDKTTLQPCCTQDPSPHPSPNTLNLEDSLLDPQDQPADGPYDPLLPQSNLWPVQACSVRNVTKIPLFSPNFFLTLITYGLLSYSVHLYCANIHIPLLFLSYLYDFQNMKTRHSHLFGAGEDR